METETFYNLKYDRMFKSVILNNSNYDLLNKILSDILEQEVEVIEVLDDTLQIENVNDKIKTLDLIVKTKDNILINVELNRNYNETTKIRNLMYLNTLGNIVLKKGEHYKNIMQTVQINLNYGRNPNGNESKEVYVLMEEKSHQILTEHYKIILVYLEEYKKNWYDKNVNGDLNHIYLVMLAAGKEEMQELGKKDKVVEGVKERMLYLNEDGEIRRVISREKDQEMMIKAEMEYAAEEGMAKGIKNTAKRMLKNGISDKMIAKCTNLSLEEIKKLKKTTI